MTIPRSIANAIVDPKAYAAGKPVDDAFTTLRRDMPFDKAEPDEYDPFWVVTRHEDIMEVEMQADVFHNEDRPSVLITPDAERFTRQATGGEASAVRSLVSIDGAEHKALRALTFPAFTPAAVRKLEQDIRLIARDFADRMIDTGGECDFAQDVAFLYPLRVVMRLLGIPEADEPMILRLTQQTFNPHDPELNRETRALSASDALISQIETFKELETYFTEVTRQKRLHPDGSVNSILANAKVNDEYLNARQLFGYYIIAATAGHDTTSNTTAAGMWAIAERPEVLERLKGDPSAMPGFIEETIRWATPVKHFMRTATRDTQVRGQDVAKGDWLMLSYHSANRDETAFEAPFTFDLDRKEKHMAFGYGPHVCLGQHLARMEMRLLWEELLPRLRSVELAGQPRLTESNFVCGPKYVPVRFQVN